MEYTAKPSEPENSRHVKQVQRYLHQIAMKDKSITPPAIDGIFGEETEESVRQFQRKYMRKDNGKVDIDTWQELLTAAKDAVAENAPPSPISPFCPDMLKDGRLKKGDTCDLTTIIKIMLHTISSDFCDWEDLPVNNDFDEETENAVICFQQIAGLPKTGWIDSRTWNALARLYSIYVEEDGK